MAEKQGHWVKEGRVFIQDEDGTFLELVPTADGNFDTKPAKKEDVRGADFIEGPFDPQQAAFAGQELPSETPPAPAPPGPPMPPGYTLTAEEEQEVGASSEEAQQQAEESLADEPLSDEAGASMTSFKAFYPDSGDEDWDGLMAPEEARARLEKLELDPSTVVVLQVPEGEENAGQVFVLPSTGLGSYAEMLENASPEERGMWEGAVVQDWDLLTEAAPEETPAEEEPLVEEESAATDADEDDAVDLAEDLVEEEAETNAPLADEIADPQLEGMDGRQRVSYVLQNRQEFPEFNRALRAAAEQFYRDRRLRRTSFVHTALGGLPESMALQEKREQPGRERRAELMAERERLLGAQDTARQFNIEAKLGQYEVAAGLMGDLISSSVTRAGQKEAEEGRRRATGAEMRHDVRMHDLKQQGDELKAFQEELEERQASPSGADYGADEIAKGRSLVAKALSDKQVRTLAALPPEEQALLRIELAEASGQGDNAAAVYEYFGSLSAYLKADTAIGEVSAMKQEYVGEVVAGMGTNEAVARLMQQAEARGEPISEQQAQKMVSSGVDGSRFLEEQEAADRVRLGELDTAYEGAYTEAMRSGVGKPGGAGTEAREEVLSLMAPARNADGSIDTDRTIVEVALATTEQLYEDAPELDPDSFDASIKEVESALATAKFTPLQRAIEDLRGTDQGRAAIKALTDRGYTERDAVEELIGAVGKRSFQKETRQERGALRRGARGRARPDDEAILMAQPEDTEDVVESPTEGAPGVVEGAEVVEEVAASAPTEKPAEPQEIAQAETPIFKGADYETPHERREEAKRRAVLRGLA